MAGRMFKPGPALAEELAKLCADTLAVKDLLIEFPGASEENEGGISRWDNARLMLEILASKTADMAESAETALAAFDKQVNEED